MHLQNFMIFGRYKRHKAANEVMLALWLYVNFWSPEGATNLNASYRVGQIMWHQFAFLLVTR